MVTYSEKINHSSVNDFLEIFCTKLRENYYSMFLIAIHKDKMIFDLTLSYNENSALKEYKYEE